jgi:hypothetical protein
MTRLVLELPEPPSLNAMLELAMKRTRRTRTGGWMKRAVPGIVYDQHHEAYDLTALAALRTQGVRPPPAPWPRWRIVSAELRLANLRDWTECLSSLKWPVDFLVRQGFVADDSPRELEPPPCPTQRVDRKRRGVTLVIEPVP